ncbi:MAG TPA: twin-arginine translocation signal domain-containing protein [Ardenticatenaceae bacterium]|nr:twin-arginine translocation signal domain-containing protein [Ardenticatenaceae bacterium]
MSESQNDKGSVSRREALKTVAAITGAATLASLPGKWETPVIEVGALPAFAQATPTVRISGIAASAPVGPCNVGGLAGTAYTITFSYEDPGAAVVPGAILRAIFQFVPSGESSTAEAPLQATNISGSASAGTITIPVCIAFGPSTSVNLTVTLVVAGGRTSNALTVSIANPGTPSGSSGTSSGRIVQ